MPVCRPFDGIVEYTKHVTPTSASCILSETATASRPLLLIAVIDRSHDRPRQTIYDWRHYLAVVQRKPGALRNSAPLAELPDAFKNLH